ncbi:MAG: aminotransferase class V-fold PLP-dependent enzyme [Calditrichia bacterium]
MNDKIHKFRETFSVVEEGIYVNHAAVSPMNSLHQKAFEEYYRSRSHFPVDIYPDIMKLKSEFKQNIASLIHAEGEHSIAIVSNTSTGLNIIANGLDWNVGDEIVLNTVEFPANVYPWLNLERRGVRLKWINPDDQGRITPESIISAASNKTRLVAISFVQFLSGYRADLAAIGKFCKENDIYFAVDGIQGTGVMPLDVQEMCIDFLAAGGHKWLMWPMGMGFLYIRPDLIEKIYPAFAGWLSVKDSWNFFDYRLDFLDTAEKLEGATNNFLGMTIAHKILSAFQEIGTEQISEKILGLNRILIDGFLDMGISIVSPINSGERSGILSIQVDDAENVFKALLDSGIVVSLREGRIRFSPHFYNTEDEMEHILHRLKEILLDS